jgi:CRP-like cAMP-binding protein
MTIELSTLRKIDLFESLLPDHAKLVLDIVEQVELNAGDKVFGDGDTPDRFYFIVRGKVRISKQIPGVGEEALAILEAGMYFGEMALIDESPRSADAICNTNCIFGVIDKQKFEDLLFMNKDLAYDLLWTFVRTLSERLREANEKMRAFLTMAGSF